MKIYEYAKTRNIKSKDVVNKLHELGFSHIKNHLSLVPEKVLDTLDITPFETLKKEFKPVRESKNLALVSMECAPFVSKGLGDMVRNKILYGRLAGNNIVIILPKFNMDLKTATFEFEFSTDIYHQSRSGKVYKLKYEQEIYYLVESDYYYNRDKLYGYYDDAERFAFLYKAACEVIKHTGIDFDLINVHDWPLGLFPLLSKEQFPNTLVEFSVYGATYQGIYGVDVLTQVFGLNKSYYDDHIVEYASSVNCLKAGLVTADKVDINKVALNDLKNSYLKEFVYDNM